MSGKSEFAEGLAKAAREALEEVTGLAKKNAKKAPRKTSKKPSVRGVDRGAKHWSGNKLTWAPDEPRPEATAEETANLRKWSKKKGKSGQWKDSSVERNFNTALRQDKLNKVKKVLKAKGWSWGRFVNERAKVDPNLSKLSIKQRQLRAAELLDELGTDGFIERFNL